VTAPSHVIAVVGPPLAGVTSLATVLAERLPGQEVVEGTAAAPPDVVVLVASAVAPLADSDVELLDRATARTDVMVAAVSKIDAHRGWREVLAADRALVSAHARRYRKVQWVAVAAAPDLGEPDVAELVATLREALADPALIRRNRLRANDFESSTARTQSPSAGRPSKPLKVIAMRGGIQRARLTLTNLVRRRCARLRTDLRAGAAELPRGAATRFQGEVRDAVAAFVEEVDAAIAGDVEEVAHALALTPPGTSAPLPPPELPGLRPASRRLENRLMVVLGGGFGLGVALSLGRLMGQLAPGSDMSDKAEMAGMVAGGVVGLLLTIWVVGIRGVLHDRALADRWVGEVAATLRTCGEEMIAHRLLATEMAFTTELAGRADGSREAIGKPGGGKIPRRD
jgi:hypothetical protein